MARRGVSTYLPLALMAALLVVVALAANTSGPRIGHVPPRPLPTHTQERQRNQARSLPPVPPPQGAGHGSDGGGSLSGWPMVVAVALVLALGWGAVVLYLLLTARDAVIFRRRRPVGPEPDKAVAATPSPEDLQAAVEASLAVLIEGDDPRAGVIACWLRLEALAEQAGVPRETSDAPGDLVGRMLASHGGLTGAGARALHSLTDVYRAARYSPHPVGESARETARSALDRLRAELSVRPPAPAGGGAS
ncbi:MAG: DUF4129 domain-containing protein [Actinocatenispora sp.]